MTQQERNDILDLRSEGLTYGRIAKKLGISLNTVKSFCRRETEKKKHCRNCRKLLAQNSAGRPRAFCSDECRITWWKKHPEQVNRRAFYTLTCAGCGKEFDSYGHRERKYCGHPCYIIARFGVP